MLARRSAWLACRLAPRSAALSSKPTKKSPFARPEPKAAGSGLDKYEELKQRQDAIAEMMRANTMREVNRAAQQSGRRPEGVSHMLTESEAPGPSLSEAVKKLVDNEGVGAKYDEESDEWGGPKGKEPTRYGDWEVKGRISDF